jgi:hypothetical protein
MCQRCNDTVDWEAIRLIQVVEALNLRVFDVQQPHVGSLTAGGPQRLGQLHLLHTVGGEKSNPYPCQSVTHGHPLWSSLRVVFTATRGGRNHGRVPLLAFAGPTRWPSVGEKRRRSSLDGGVGGLPPTATAVFGRSCLNGGLAVEIGPARVVAASLQTSRDEKTGHLSVKHGPFGARSLGARPGSTS